MKGILIVLVALLVTSCSYTPLDKMSRELRSNFTYISDEDKWGVENYVERRLPPFGTPFTGDCEEYVIMGLKGCREYGLTCKYALVYTEIGEAHLILISGERVIDNRYWRVMDKEELDYEWR